MGLPVKFESIVPSLLPWIELCMIECCTQGERNGEDNQEKTSNEAPSCQGLTLALVMHLEVSVWRFMCLYMCPCPSTSKCHQYTKSACGSHNSCCGYHLCIASTEQFHETIPWDFLRGQKGEGGDHHHGSRGGWGGRWGWWSSRRWSRKKIRQFIMTWIDMSIKWPCQRFYLVSCIVSGHVNQVDHANVIALTMLACPTGASWGDPSSLPAGAVFLQEIEMSQIS